jgi:hypothetical protein
MGYEKIKDAVTKHFGCDPETGGVFRLIASNRLAAGSSVGHLMKNGYMAVTVPGVRVKVYCHHVVYFLCTGRWGPECGVQIDHRDCRRTNNQLKNLREASPSLNSVNSYIPQGASAYTTKRGERFRAQLMIGGTRYEKAGFLSSKEATEWYLSEKRIRSTEFFGEIVGA